MRVFITGATGFVGRALVLRLRRDGHELSAWVRSPARARAQLGGEVALVASRGGDAALDAALAHADAIVNLAGASVAARRWTAARMRELRASRVDLTDRLVRALERARTRPRVLLSGSAVGYYGDRGGERLDEQAPPGRDPLADLCRDWERSAQAAEALGARVVRLRIGVVLGREGGALAKMLPVFRLGLGGAFGDGRQVLSWIHLHDLVEMLATALVDERYAGPVNATAPEPVTSREFARALGAAVHRPALLRVPALALRAALGRSSTALLASQRVVPARATELGFRFAYPSLSAALAQAVGPPAVRIEALGAGTPPPLAPPAARGELAHRPPRYLLRATATLERPLDDVFAFFSEPSNLGVITPAAMGFQIVEPAPTSAPAEMAEGARIRYRLRVGPFPVRWRTRIAVWEPGRVFVDTQEAGPYRAWWHEHHFRPDGEHRTVVEDRVYYAPPLGLLGRLANRLFIRGALTRIFGYRADAIRLRFG